MELIYEEHENNLVVHAKKCGQTFRNIAIVMGFKNEEPLIFVPTPLGFSALSLIIKELERLKRG